MAQITESKSIYSIGYGSRSIEQFIQVLQQFQIDYLLDVRSKPYSSFKPEFGRDALETSLRSAGIKYVYLGDALGGRPDLASCYTPDGKVDYDAIRQKDFFLKGIERLINAYRQGLRVVMMCSEAKPEMCHRTKLIGETLIAQNIAIAHIDEENKLIDQATAMLRLTSGQLGFSGWFDEGQTSRKKYRDVGDNEDRLDE